MTALHWTPEGKCKRGRPNNTWRRTVEGDIKTMNNTWGQSERWPRTDRNGGSLLLPYMRTTYRAVNK
jgi:hypothetical protein